MSSGKSNVVPLYQIQRYGSLKNGFVACWVSENRFWNRTPVLASQKVARPGRNCPPDAFGLVNQEVVIELVNEEPTEEMISALERFWEKVFVELLPAEESSVKAKRKKQ